ncbi:MAG TPA: aminotransferase class V-fold PLP-dependent enzyme [Candidatus Eisenbacteria bacterium]|jgi:kynureninase|nr:aminotransferase class V-fold PLP-dependent enzyme [Candidatus Eisenbacteria bacterium]
MDDLLRYRPEFPILDRTTYLISNSLGAMPRGVYDSMHTYADAWANRGVRAWEEGWWEMAVDVGDKIAPLIGAQSGEISLHQNVTLTQAIISSCFDFRGPRNKVLMTDLEFPSIQYFYHGQRRLGARVEVVLSNDPVRFDLDQFLAAIDETTLLVPISLVLFRSSWIVDARAIIERAHRVGAHVILDVFQATGSMPIDVRALGADFAVGGVLKWLCGGPGVAYLYVREDLRAQLSPALTGWNAHRRPFAFEPGAIDAREDSYRYLNGTPQIPALHACLPGLDILNQAGIHNIREKSIRLTTRLLEGAQSRGWRVNTPQNSAERAGTLSIDCPHAPEVSRELLAREVLCDYRPRAGIRFSPHFYNREQECDFALAQIEEILRTDAWRKHAAVRVSA